MVRSCNEHHDAREDHGCAAPPSGALRRDSSTSGPGTRAIAARRSRTRSTPCRAASSAPATGDANTSTAAGSEITSEISQPTTRARRCGSCAVAEQRRAARSAGTSTAACVSCASAARTTASLRRSRRQQPMASMSIAAAHRNGSCPSSKASTSAGLTSTATAHQPRRSSGKLQNVASTRPTKPAPSTKVTLHSPMSGHSSTATIHGMNA